MLAPDWKPSPELRIATAKAGVNLIREVTLFVAYYTQEKPEHRSANWDATYRRWLERDIQNLKMGRDPNNIALHPENLPANGRLPERHAQCGSPSAGRRLGRSPSARGGIR